MATGDETYEIWDFYDMSSSGRWWTDHRQETMAAQSYASGRRSSVA